MNPEKSLAKAKILRALLDLTSNSRVSEAQFDKKNAHYWIFTESTDFAVWCDIADMHPDDVRAKAREAIERGLNHRAAYGQGKRYLERRAYRMKHKISKMAEAHP